MQTILRPRLSLDNGKETNKESTTLEPLHFSYNNSSNNNIKSETTTQRRTATTMAPSITREIVFFFLAGVGSTVAWTAVLSNLVYYTSIFGTISFPVLNVAVYFPLLPTSLAQAFWDTHYDAMFGSLGAFSFRGSIAFFFMCITTLLIPLARHSLPLLTTMTFIIGTASAILYGTLNQLASLVFPDSGALPAAYTSGLQASAGLVLITSLGTGFGGTQQHGGGVRAEWEFYGVISVLVGVSWFAFVRLISTSHSVRRSMDMRDSSLTQQDIASLSAPFLDDNSNNEAKESLGERMLSSSSSSSSLMDISPSQPLPTISDTDVTFLFLWKRTWPCCASLIITVASSMAVASSFNQTKSTNPTSDSLPRILFYVRLFSDLLGRPATLLFPPRSVSCVGLITAARLIFVPLFFLDVNNTLVLGDWGMIFGVAAFAFTSGYVATGIRQLAPNALTDTRTEVTVPKQSSLINVSFSMAVLLGLVVTFVLLLKK